MAGLPFLNHKKMASSIMMKAKPAGGAEDVGVEGESSVELMSAAEDLIRGINMKDAQMVADALSAAFEYLDASYEEEPQLGE